MSMIYQLILIDPSTYQLNFSSWDVMVKFISHQYKYAPVDIELCKFLDNI